MRRRTRPVAGADYWNKAGLRSYVAVRANLAGRALERLQAGKIKGRKFRVRRL